MDNRKHCMRDNLQTREQAVVAWQAFIDDRAKVAGEELDCGRPEAAAEAIGQALHSIQDCHAHSFMSWPGHIFGTQFPFNEPSALLTDSFPDPADVFAAELDSDNYVERFHFRNLFLVHQLQ